MGRESAIRLSHSAAKSAPTWSREDKSEEPKTRAVRLMTRVGEIDTLGPAAEEERRWLGSAW